MAAIPRVNLADLQPLHGCIADSAYATASEKLAVALSRNGAAVVTLGQAHAAALKAGLQSAMLLGDSVRSLPGCEVKEFRVGGPAEAAVIEEAYGVLEGVARCVLSALCRSSLLRLRADAFSGLLDDQPLSRSARGSSCLTASSFVDNFSHLSESEGAAVLPLFADPQEPAACGGLLGLTFCREARGTGSEGALSALQALDCDGRWQEAALGGREVLVVVGHLLQHATAGLLRAGSRRVVGDPYACEPSRGASAARTSHCALSFELRPQPAATLDLRQQLEAAGHTISTRFSPASVSSLLEQFEALLSPAKVATPDQQQGAAAHAAWDELQATLLKKGKKRASLPGSTGAEQSSVLGQRVTRSRAGQLGKQQSSGTGVASGLPTDKENSSGGAGMEWEGGAAGGAARRRSSMRPGSAGSGGGARFSLGSAGAAGIGRRASAGEGSVAASLCIVRGRTCAVLDGCLEADPSECLTICVRSFTGLERWFYAHSGARLGALFEAYCSRLGIGLGAVRFMLRGERVFGAATPQELQMNDGMELTVVPETSDRLQQQRELGPLFAAVFGAAAAPSRRPGSGLPELN